MLTAIRTEASIRQDFLNNDTIDSIYLGGGTPSVLDEIQLQELIDHISNLHTVSPSAEITVEANPEDLTRERVRLYKQIGVNRLSIGIQSFDQRDLDLMNRAHTVQQSHQAIENALHSGITNISIDLMFGLVSSDLSSWQHNVEQAISYRPQHISCYNLTIEEQTAYAHWIKKDKIQLPDEEIQFDQFILADELLTAAGYDHYEISNYSLPSAQSKHNTSYWKKAPYLGLGPAAHSYMNGLRCWNVSDNQKYIKAITNGQIPFEQEQLSPMDQYNEMIMLSLRTAIGVPIEAIESLPKYLRDHFYRSIEPVVSDKRVIADPNGWRLPVSSWYQSDAISSELFYTD